MLVTQAAREGRYSPVRSANARREKPVGGRKILRLERAVSVRPRPPAPVQKLSNNFFALDTEGHEFHQPAPILRSIDEGPRTELRHRALLGAPCKRLAWLGRIETPPTCHSAR